MMIRKFVLLIVLATLFGCKGDNDDIIKSNDVINIDLTEGIVFGFINPLNTGENVIYRYTDEGTFLITNAGGTPSTVTVLNSSLCPYAEGSLVAELTKGVPNVARGVRDIVMTDIGETFAEGEEFFILEYMTSDESMTAIQFTDEQRFNEEQINSYFSYIKDTLAIIGDNPDSPPTTCL